MARRSAAEIATGGVVLLVAAGFLAFAVSHTGRSATNGYSLTANFEAIDGIAAGSDVRLAGVKIGSVMGARIDPQTYQANVSFTVQDGLKLPKDSSAEIVSDGFLGSKYLSLVPGGSDQMLAPGQRVTITQSSVSLEQLLGKFIFGVSDLASAVQKTLPSNGAQPAQGGGAGSNKPAVGTGGDLPPLGSSLK
jgi:phospholipid/cholesterol/gamma-HCH transport system substrate-binding protein